MKLYIIAGHGAGDPGAVGNGYQEAERVRALAGRLGALGGNSVIVCDTSRNWYADGGISSYPFSSDAQILELHMDSFSSSAAKGGSVLIKPGIGGADSHDVSLANFISAYFPGRSQKIKEQSLGNADRAYARRIPYRLLETCFISNPEDILKFNGNIDAVAKGILGAFGVTVTPAPTPTPTPPSNDELFRVRKSWADSKSQLGAFKEINNAKRLADSKAETVYPYKVFNSKGEQVHPK